MLRIIADDLGLHKSVNDGIVYLLKNNKINGASLMPNGEAFEDAVKQCIDDRLPNIGIHFNLVEQKSLILGKQMPKDHRVFFVKYLLGLIKKDFIQRELKAQVQKVVKTGVKPTFINGNQHLHLLPGIAGIVIKLAKEYDIPYIRVVNEPVSLFSGHLFRKLQLVFLRFLSKLAKKKIKNAGLECNNFFVGFTNAGNMNESDIRFAKKLAEQYPDSIIELGCHPGYEDKILREKYKNWGQYHWQDELSILKELRK